MTPVPSRRLLWFVAALIPAAAIAGPVPQLWPLCVFALVATGVVSALDLLITLRRAQMPKVEASPLNRLTKDRKSKIALTLSYDDNAPRRVRFALSMPASFESEQSDLFVDLPVGGKRVFLNWSCTALRRGRFQAMRACLEASSHWGFWMLRQQELLTAGVRVYPNLFSERKQLAALFLNRGLAGVQLRRMVGRGREFERLREYQPGDSFDEVHWKGTAKRGRPIYQGVSSQRTQEIYVIIDASRTQCPTGHPGRTSGHDTGAPHHGRVGAVDGSRPAGGRRFRVGDA